MRIIINKRAREEYDKQLGIPPGIPTMKGHYGEAEYTGDAISLDSLDLSDTGTPTGWPKKPIFAPPGGPPGPPIQWGDDITNDNADLGFGYIGGGLEEQDSYFYHSDHLGSTSYLTDLKGNVRQYTAYMPYGESFVSEHTTSTELPYLFNGKPLDEETGLYYYGARYFTPSEAVWYGVDPLAGKYPNTGSYIYCYGNPIIYADLDGKDGIIIVFPDYEIDTESFLGKMELGHAGILLINNKTGFTKYYEYGRYATKDGTKGRVRTISVSNVVIGKDGKPTIESLNKVLGELSNKAGKNGKIEGAYIISDEFEAMNNYAQEKLQESNPEYGKKYNKDRKSYKLLSNNCGTFAADVVNQDPTVDQPWIVIPTPTNIVDEYQEEGNARVQYDPATKKTTIGKGDESDAKK